MSWLCATCGNQYEQHKEYKAHQCGVKPTVDEGSNTPLTHLKAENEPIQEAVQITEEVKTTPITLEYIFKGECPACKRGVSTLELEVASKYYAVAYCVFCKKQHEQREVVKL